MKLIMSDSLLDEKKRESQVLYHADFALRKGRLLARPAMAEAVAAWVNG